MYSVYGNNATCISIQNYIYIYILYYNVHVYIHTLHIYIYIQTQCFLITVNIPGVCACPWISTGPCSLPGIGGGKVQGTERISVAADVGNPCCHQGIPSGDSSYQPFMVILGIVYYGFIVVNNGLSLVILDMMEPNNVHMLQPPYCDLAGIWSVAVTAGNYPNIAHFRLQVCEPW